MARIRQEMSGYVRKCFDVSGYVGKVWIRQEISGASGNVIPWEIRPAWLLPIKLLKIYHEIYAFMLNLRPPKKTLLYLEKFDG